jgi:mono/diheme cytochrome c family protein
MVCLALTVSPLGALAADTGNGEAIAKRWCASCHLVSSDQARANADVPSFASLARKKQRPERLEAFLSAPHPKMPDMTLSRSEIADLVAYIGSLRR